MKHQIEVKPKFVHSLQMVCKISQILIGITFKIAHNHHLHQSHDRILLQCHCTAKHQTSSLHISRLKAREIFIHTQSVSWASRPGLAHITQGVKPRTMSFNLKAQLDHGLGATDSTVDLPLTSVQQASYPAKLCHHRTGSYRVQSPLLCCVAVNPTKTHKKFSQLIFFSRSKGFKLDLIDK